VTARNFTVRQSTPATKFAMDPSSRPQRSRTKTGFSVRSDRSSNSGKSHGKKPSLVETSAEKRKRHLSANTKANPNNAMNEAQPGGYLIPYPFTLTVVVALALEKATLMSLQNLQCNDVYGNPISMQACGSRDQV
jgi:hypothetical protein